MLKKKREIGWRELKMANLTHKKEDNLFNLKKKNRDGGLWLLRNFHYGSKYTIIEMTKFVKLTASPEIRSFIEQPLNLRILWAISGLQHSRKDLFRSHGNLRSRYFSHKPPEFMHEDDQFLSNIYIWKGA